MNVETTMSSESKAVRLARYLKEFVGLRSTTIFDVNKYDSVLWFGDMPQEPGCESPAWNDGFSPGDPWLVVKKQQFPKPPLPPEIILPWVDQQALRQATAEAPSLRKTIHAPDYSVEVLEGEDAPLTERQVDDYPEVKQAYEMFCPTWLAWSEEYQRRNRIQSVYAELFRIHTQLQKQNEILELVLGLGLIVWNPTKGKSPAIIRHAVTGRVDLHFDSTTGTIRLDGAAEGARLRIEDDMLEAELRPERNQYSVVEDQLNKIGDDVWDLPILFTALNSWASSLHPDSVWSTDLKLANLADSRPHMTFAPALILRKRTQGGMVRIYEALIERLSSGLPDISSGWVGLVSDEDDQDLPDSKGSSNEATATSYLDSNEIYFPLPANREQKRIVEAISHRRGVLVQGPPGTGKSHTIANLVCHLLATGKKVLITAETGRALKVLKDKLPLDIQPLCISLLGQGGDSFAELNSSVQEITTRFASWHPGAYDNRISEIDSELSSCRRTLATIDTELRTLREDETCPHSLMNGAYSGTASKIAQRVATERDRFSWLRIPRDARDDPPLTGMELLAWLDVCRLYEVTDIDASKLRVVETETLLSPAQFAAAVTSEKEALAAVHQLASLRDRPAYGSIISLDANSQIVLAQKLHFIRERRNYLSKLGYTWLSKVMKDALEGRKAKWKALLDESLEKLERIRDLFGRLGSSVVTLPLARDVRAVRADATIVFEHIKNGGKWTSFGVMTPKVIKDRTYVRDEIMVDGRPADSQDRLHTVCDYLELMVAFRDLEVAWQDHDALPAGSQARIRAVAIKEYVDCLSEALDYAKTCMELGQELRGVIPGIPEPDWQSGDSDELLDIIDASSLEQKYWVTAHHVTACLSQLKVINELHDKHPAIAAMVSAVENREVTEYGKAYDRLYLVEKARRDLELRSRIESLIGTAVPGMINSVLSTIEDSAWNDRFADWADAWHWAVADNWLEKRSDFSYRKQLWDRRNETDQSIRNLLTESAALRAWTHFFNRLTPAQSAALKSWREAVKAMGKGTSRSAKIERLRREARLYMDQCRDAIPVWIMPRYLVAEMIDPAPGRYDIVIVDEASQLGIESLFLFYISKKMVVVGDDQQISPYGVGISDDSISDLQHHYLDGVPHQHALSAQSSLYSNAKIRFGQNIVLREHFRCMPEIIQFSNDLCYANNGTPLDPLRAYPATRLTPLVVRHVPEGYRTGNSQNASNEPEADAMLSQIKGCISDPRYTGLTMGVISLQGEAQAKLIEYKLHQSLEPEIIEERRLICGDAYAFQGDERHIIFLSMVAAPGETRIGALSTDAARQRFNVAASRAQDQLWLFHSATLDLLSPSCMRHRLLGYMQNPGRQMSDPKTNRFDSQFERDVFELITGKGYYVRTQVAVGDPTNHRYRIDLVVEGMQGRIAVECDGDEWHGPDRYEQDMARQRDLERAGWQFVRIRGGEFYRDRDRATELLWRELERLGIRPGGVDESAAEPPPPAEDSISEYSEFDEFSDFNSDTDNGADIDSSGSDEEPIVHSEGKRHSNGQDNYLAKDRLTGLVLADYKAYDGPPKPDPRTVNPGTVAEGLCEIIEAEGPMIAKRAYDIYLRSCGIKRLGGELKSTMNKALSSAIRQGKVISENEPGKSGLILSVVRSSGSEKVKLRRRGPRTFEEITPAELRIVAQNILEANQMVFGSDEHLRAILECFDLKRLTTQVGTALLEVLETRA